MNDDDDWLVAGANFPFPGYCAYNCAYSVAKTFPMPLTDLRHKSKEKA